MYVFRYIFENVTIAQPIERDLQFIEQEFERQEMKLDEKLKNSLLSVRQSYNEMRQKNVNLEERIRELTERINVLKHTDGCSTLSKPLPTNTSQLQREIKIFEQIGPLNLGNAKASDLVCLQKKGLSNYFERTCEEVKQKCPILTSLLRTLVTGSKSGDNDGKYTETFKFKEALPVLSFISHIRNQRSSSDFPVLFGLLLIAHGGGKSLISLLASIGLCRSYEW